VDTDPFPKELAGFSRAGARVLANANGIGVTVPDPIGTSAVT
jgi:hypothetical protein